MPTETLNCSHTLRAVGQMLEALRIDSFNLRVEGGDFHVRDRIPRQNRNIYVRYGLAGVWISMSLRDPQFERSFQSTGVLRFRITPEDVALLEEKGLQRRQHNHQVPEIGAPSQILRAVGGFIDHKRGRLLAVSKNDQDVYFEFELPSGEAVMERFTVSSLYDYWVKMYLRRADRHPQPS